MTPAEFKAIRKSLGFAGRGTGGVARFAALIGIADGATVRKWERAARPIPGPVAVLMRLLKSGRLTIDDLVAIADNDVTGQVPSS